MHTNNLQLLKSEASRLIELNRRILTEVSNVPGLVGEVSSDASQTLDATSVAAQLELLEGERRKLEDMDMVVAVVGTMKAGKSTTINAIVGREVLPNRNEPMTSIPTLIRHVTDRAEPVLRFDNSEPMNALCDVVRDVLQKNPDIRAALLAEFEGGDIATAIDFVLAGKRLATRYEGQQGIFDFLKTINDLVRISSSLDVDFPFSDYDEMHELPVIEVAFTSLPSQSEALGRLTLLDTPGPNEAGQSHFKLMVRDQLQKASAVMLVLNYTQLKSESDHALRQDIAAIADMAEGRIYALVNRYDERSHNDPDEQRTKQMVAGLLSGRVPDEAIFCISARQAFLGCLALNCIDDTGELPDPRNHPWVEAFGRDCFGVRWASELQSVERVLEGAKGYWDESRFAFPLERVIHAAHEKAAYYALESTASKLVVLAEKLSTFVSGRETALHKTAAELRRVLPRYCGHS